MWKFLLHLNDKWFVLSLSPYSSVWQSVQSSVDFTIPLYKWDKSYMQERYYGALRVDPMVRKRYVTIFKDGVTCRTSIYCVLDFLPLRCVAFAKTWSPSYFCFWAGKLFQVSTLECLHGLFFFPPSSLLPLLLPPPPLVQTPLSAPLGSQSAAEDLMESFGFESELEPQEGNVPSGGGSGFRQDSGKEWDSKVGMGEKG